jgi:uncharacterized protein
VRKNLAGLIFGAFFGAVAAWAHLADPDVIRDMLMLREVHVFLLMGCAVAVAAIGSRILRNFRVLAPLADEIVNWDLVRPEARHVTGSVLFGVGWSLAGTCPGPAAIMIGEGRLAGIAVVLGMIAGVVLQGARDKHRRVVSRSIPEPARAPGL